MLLTSTPRRLIEAFPDALSAVGLSLSPQQWTEIVVEWRQNLAYHDALLWLATQPSPSMQHVQGITDSNTRREVCAAKIFEHALDRGGMSPCPQDEHRQTSVPAGDLSIVLRSALINSSKHLFRILFMLKDKTWLSIRILVLLYTYYLKTGIRDSRLKGT